MRNGSNEQRRFAMRTGRRFWHIPQCIFMCVLISMCCSTLVAQEGHAHAKSTNQQLTSAQGELLRIVRESTTRFKDVSVAEGEQYKLQFGCVTGPDAGAMG